jgi:hypothetical protein
MRQHTAQISGFYRKSSEVRQASLMQLPQIQEDERARFRRMIQGTKKTMQGNAIAARRFETPGQRLDTFPPFRTGGQALPFCRARTNRTKAEARAGRIRHGRA